MVTQDACRVVKGLLTSRTSWVVVIASVIGCSAVSAPSGSPIPQDVTLFINPLCPVFQRAASDFRPRELKEATENLAVTLRWRPVVLNSTPCEFSVAMFILCAAEVGDPAWVVENLASSEIPLGTCGVDTLESLFSADQREAQALSQCVKERGQALLVENSRYLESAGINRVPYYAIGSGKPRRMSSLRRVLEALRRE